MNSLKEWTDEEITQYFRQASYTMTYMSICLTCTIWQILHAGALVWKTRKFLHGAVFFETILSFFSILCSVLNPLTELSCELRFWVSIISVNLGGCCIQSILLYKAYICYDRAKSLIIIGSIINLGYVALTFLYATLGRVPTYKDFTGHCLLNNLEWPALAKLGLDIASNAFLSLAFLLVIHKHYRIFGNSLHKSLLSSGMLFSVGVIASNVITAILISSRVMGGLSADLYSFDWVITGYLLIKQFKMDRNKDAPSDQVSQTMQSNASTLSHTDGELGYGGFLSNTIYPRRDQLCFNCRSLGTEEVIIGSRDQDSEK
ncbi:uncharacterized protein BYT42DRAFT_576413 [Radiomyces spectabilis]|uniref:uncharacterized protein n=1 Tax=Radiomyces spectabilis TaxID=64574 RepID=UPI00221E99C8|nr:uncharacterized protein BYT42DRAFT_576413 [Radiomyces spectabilis]KAI8374452.1 hypothetical protein BYT42DRAFT_576413 [Radiomyces spectabilis]